MLSRSHFARSRYNAERLWEKIQILMFVTMATRRYRSVHNEKIHSSGFCLVREKLKREREK